MVIVAVMANMHGPQWAGIRYAKVIEEAITAGALGDLIEWDFAPIITVTEEGEPSAGYVLILSCRSMMLVPPRIAVCAALPDGSPVDAVVCNLVTTSLDQLYHIRSEMNKLRAN
jgi:hypothetical protein